MKVICAGLCKTGTKSLARALRVLGYNVYDIEEQIFEFHDEWHELVQHGKLPDFKSMFEKVDAVTDLPANFYFAEILEAFPDAKVILMTRDEASWLKSAAVELEEAEKLWGGRNRVFAFTSPLFAKVKHFSIALMNATFGTCNPKATQIHRHHFHMHNSRVQTSVPKGQLLVYNVKEGWEPLCEFLGKDVPQESFPHLNKEGSFTREYPPITGKNAVEVQVLRETAIRLTVLVAVLAVLLWAYFA